MFEAVREVSLPLPRVGSGKVRELFDAGEGRLLLVATDRLSAFDVILDDPIPGRGVVLNRMSLFWFDFFRDVVPGAVLTADVEAMDLGVELSGETKAKLHGRSVLMRRAEMFPVECVVRGYLAGSGYKDYIRTGAVCGIALPGGLRKADKLPEPLFTPATKAESGHDENISFEEAARIVGAGTAEKLRDLSLTLYTRAAEHAAERGIIIADTKFEFGVLEGEIVLADEVLTPDSSRFWPADRVRPGEDPPSYDKQIVRNYLETLKWGKTPPGPELPEEVAAKTGNAYREVLERLTK